MRKFSVTFYETNALTVTVEAENKQDAIAKAEALMESNQDAFDEETLGLDGNQNVEEIKEEVAL
jgi:hypothetical protein